MKASLRTWLIIALLYGVLAAAGAFWWSIWGRAESGEQELDRDAAAAGEKVYRAHCAVCHGPEGRGHPNWREQNPDGTYPPPPHGSTGHTWHHSDGILYRIVRNGGGMYEGFGFRTAMPAFRDVLTPEETRAVIAYLKTLWGPQEREFQARASEGDPFPVE